MNITPPGYPVLDGFLLDTSLKCDLGFRSLALVEWDRLRRAGSFRSKFWCIPEDSRIVIPAFDSYEKEVPCVPGSAIWGFTFVSPSGSGPFSIQIRDVCTDVAIASEVIRTDQFNAGTNGQPQSVYQQPFSKLLVVAHQGLISVEICSLQATIQNNVQLVLYGGEPVCP
jgi:hypothetical protein